MDRQIDEELYLKHITKVHYNSMYVRAVRQIQIFDSAKKTAESVQGVSESVIQNMPRMLDAVTSIEDVAGNAKITLNSVTRAAEEAKTLMETVRTALTPVQIKWRNVDLVPTLLKIVRIIVNLCLASSGCRLASFLFNVASEFGSEIVQLIKNALFSDSAVQLCPKYKEAKKEGILDDVSNMASVREWMVENGKLTTTTLAVSMYVIINLALGLPKRSMDTEKALGFFGNRCKHLKSITDFAKSSWSIFSDIAEHITEGIFPGLSKKGLDMYLVDYTKWSEEVISLVSAANPIADRMKTEKKLLFQVERLYKKGLQYSTNLNALKIKDDMRDHFQKTFRIVEGFMKEAANSGAMGNTARIKPYIIHLFGESGVGKSGMLWPLCADLNMVLCDEVKKAEDVAAEVYFRAAEQEFWDGYAGQNICVWDDFGQLTDTSANANPEFFEIIRAGNSAPMPLHMASLNEKARTKFISKFCILTSNKISQQVSSLTHPAAYRRRIDLLAEVRIKDEYAMAGYDSEKLATTKRLDPSKLTEGANTNVYEFTLYNAETHQPITVDNQPVVLEYDDLLKKILHESSDNFETSMVFNVSVNSRICESRHAELSKLFKRSYVPPKKEGTNLPSTSTDITKDWDKPPAPEVREEVARALQLTKERKEAQKQMMEEVDLDNEWIVERADESDAIADLFRGIDDDVEMPPPVQESWLRGWQKEAKKWLSIRKVLSAAALILGGLGVWGLFKYLRTEDKEEQALVLPVPEGFTHVEGDPTKIKLIQEASASGDAKTKNLKRARTEIANVRKSKIVSRALRHQIITCDGYVAIPELLEHLKSKDISRQDLFDLWREDPKQRFEIDISQDKMRCVQGHSFEIDPELFYERVNATSATHFTYKSRIPLIKEKGILRMNRAFVHLHEGHLTHPPNDLPNRNTAIWLNLEGLDVWKTSNGYLLCKEIPSDRILTIRDITYQQEASASGDSRTRNLRKVKTEGSVELQAWKDKTAQDLISHRLIGNLYKVAVDGIERLNGLFVRDTCMLTVQHLLPTLRRGKTITITNMYGATFTVPTSDLETRIITDSQGRYKDAMIIKFPRHVHCHADIVKHFQKEPELAHRRADVALPCIRKMGEIPVLTVLGNANCRIEHSHLDYDGEKVDIRDSLEYNLNTTAGDCGSPVVVNDTQFLRKIAGIHIAAYTDGSSAIGQSVTQGDLLKFMFDFEPIELDLDEYPNIKTKNVVLQLNTEYTTEQLVKVFDMPAPTFTFAGDCGKIAHPPLATDIRPSVIHGYVKPTTKPAFLRHPTVNMVHRNMEKCAINCPHISQEEVDRAVGETAALLLSGNDGRLNRILTYEEAIAGSDISEYIDGIKRRSSPGYPHVFNKKSEFPGKTTWFGKDEWIFSEEIKAIVEERIEWARQGRRYPTVWSDTLKDERRPIEKVDALKTRVFAHGPMDYTIAFRMYFLGFIAHIMENRIRNEQSVGTNPFGMDWIKTAKKLSTFGNKVFAGDFSQFDGTLNSCIMKEFAAVANRFYGDGPENARIREVLMVEIYNSVHLCSGKFIQLTHSQPSGNPLTTVLNSFYNSVSMRIAYYRCMGPKAPAFGEHVSMVSYGDDNVVNFSDQVAEKFNQNTVTRAYATFGMIYTDEAKTGGEMADWRDLSEVNYLKRNFRFEDGVWRAPLALETLLETVNWVRKSPDELEACITQCETVFRELAQHPAKVFKENVEMIANALYERTGHFPVIYPRHVYLEDESPAW